MTAENATILDLCSSDIAVDLRILTTVDISVICNISISVAVIAGCFRPAHLQLLVLFVIILPLNWIRKYSHCVSNGKGLADTQG